MTACCCWCRTLRTKLAQVSPSWGWVHPVASTWHASRSSSCPSAKPSPAAVIVLVVVVVVDVVASPLVVVVTVVVDDPSDQDRGGTRAEVHHHA